MFKAIKSLFSLFTLIFTASNKLVHAGAVSAVNATSVGVIASDEYLQEAMINSKIKMEALYAAHEIKEPLAPFNIDDYDMFDE